jgi:uncharacterized FlgJ-related protein
MLKKKYSRVREERAFAEENFSQMIITDAHSENFTRAERAEAEEICQRFSASATSLWVSVPWREQKSLRRSQKTLSAGRKR